jgi:hypothetical protein
MEITWAGGQLMSIFKDQQIALLTQHGKEQAIASILEPALGCVIRHVSGFDTDQLGTFTRDQPRLVTQLEAARLKARKGIELSGLPIGIASEGSFGADPYVGFLPWNVELLVLMDDRSGIELVGMAQGAARNGHLQTSDWTKVEAFAKREGFPDHQLVLRPNDEHDSRIYKGIADWSALQSCFEDCVQQSEHAQVFIETDLRAFANPTRMNMIRQATDDLLKRMTSYCPACDAVGYWITERKAGLPCSSCGIPTASYKSEVWSCRSCSFQTIQQRTDRIVEDPKYCQYCNP